MDDRAIVDLVLGGGALAGWLIAYGLVRLVTRPVRPAPGAATPDLGPESPAVVSLLVNRWSITEDAAESTLLDLAARRFVELRQPGDDPMQTTVHLPASPPPSSGLRPYEIRVLDRIRGLTVGGVVPLTALTFREAGQAKAWSRHLRTEVVADARAAGLSRRRFGPGTVTLLVGLALLAAMAVGGAALHYGLWTGAEENGGVVVGLITFGVLGVISGIPAGERDTPLGRQVAARWLGVRDWLRAHEQFADLPPASVMLWDRYLGYGAAVGVTHVASAVLDLGLGNRALVWSSFGGVWHRVRVGYPRGWPRYGQPTKALLKRAGFVFLAAAILVAYASRWDFAAGPARLLAVLLLAVAAYTLSRVLVDLATERTITGEVLWLQEWRSTPGGEDQPSRPWLYHLAVDDGTGDRTTAWGLPSEWEGRCHYGDTVTIRVRPWSRRVTRFEVVDRGRPRQIVEMPAAANLSAPTGPRAADLLTAEEVGQAFGTPVRAGGSLMVPGPLAGAQFVSEADGRGVLLIQCADGATGKWAWRANSRGQALPGIGDGAFTSGPRGALRVGETTVVITLMGGPRERRARLPWLLARCADRMATEPR